MHIRHEKTDTWRVEFGKDLEARELATETLPVSAHFLIYMPMSSHEYEGSCVEDMVAVLATVQWATDMWSL